MSEWTPKVGDKVMVGEHGPYKATQVAEVAERALLDTGHPAATWVPFAWLTPAPEPEPDQPTAPGALVRDGEDDLVALGDDLTDEPAWVVLTGDLCGEVVLWSDLPRPITVILADPAEVEQLRAEATGLRKTIDKVLLEVDRDGYATKAYLDMVFRGGL